MQGGSELSVELRRQMAMARELYQHHDYDRAEPLLKEILVQHPASAEMFNLLGIIQHHRGRFADAQTLFEQALRINPSYTEAALNLAVIYNDMGRYTEAREVYGSVVRRARSEPGQIDPFARGKLANLHADTAEAYRTLGLYPEALREYRQALALCPSFPDLHVQLAMTCSEMGDRNGAVAALQEALRLHPRYVQGLLLLGAELYTLGRKDEAQEAWMQAQRLEPENRRARAYLNLCQTHKTSQTSNT